MIGYLTPNYPLVAAFRDQPVVRTRVKNRPTTGLFKTAPNLADYFPADEILASKGDLDRPISGLASDSRRVLAGNVFLRYREIGQTGMLLSTKPSVVGRWPLSPRKFRVARRRA